MKALLAILLFISLNAHAQSIYYAPADTGSTATGWVGVSRIVAGVPKLFHLQLSSFGGAAASDSTIFYTKYRSDTSRTNLYAAIRNKTVSIATANGFAGTVNNASGTPAITLSTPITGLLKGSGGAVVAATAGTDYATPAQITGTNSGTNTGDETTARINALYGYTPANPSTVSLKVNISDTASMLSTYYRTITATGALALKVNVSDTGAMLSPYYRTISAGSKVNISDTGAMLSTYYRTINAASKVNVSDTAGMLSTYYRAITAGLKVNVSDTGSMLTNYVRAATATTLTNKRWVARNGSTTSSTTPTINTDNYDSYELTAQTADITSFTTNLTGTPNNKDLLEISITGTAARAIAWGSAFVSSTVTLPTTTITTATLTVVFQYFTTSSYGNNKWVCVNSF